MKALKSVFAVAIAMLLAVATVGTQAATTYQGVDVSKWQPNYDFAEAKRDGVKVVFLRSSLADTVQDTSFNRHYAETKATGLKIGAYHFLYAGSGNKRNQRYGRWKIAAPNGAAKFMRKISQWRLF